jgi:catechol 2,3-dioxygenase-like lactoylglutathione lyase family enzyme
VASIFRIIVPVSDIEAARVFYSRVLGAPGKRVSPGRHYFDCDGTILACFDPAADGDGYTASPLSEPVYVAVDDLEAAYEACREAGAHFSSETTHGPMGEIAVRPWGEESFYASDPFGNPLCLVRRGTEFTG